MFRFSSRFTRALGWALLAASVALPSLPAIPAQAAPGTFVVNTTNDSDNLCTQVPVDCSLREAIKAANSNAGQDTIAFNIPGDGVQTIRLTSDLPRLTEAAVIDGYTQPGATENTAQVGTNANLMIEVTGKEEANTGLTIAAPVTVRGLVIHGFKAAIAVLGDQGGQITLQGSFIGADPTGTALKATVFGVSTHDLAGARIGGPSPADRNLIAGSAAALSLDGPGEVIGNLLGTDRTATKALGGAARAIILNTDDMLIARNTIAFNENVGIAVRSGTGNIISRNTIFGNGGLGIDLNDDGPTANDPFDADNGPNKRQNFPELTAATAAGGQTTISGVLRSQRNKVYAIELFANPANDDIEAQTFLHEQTVSTDNEGNASFTVTVAQNLAGQAITATATDKLTFDTSEISSPVVVSREQAPPPDPGQGQQGTPELTSAVSPKQKKGKKGKKAKKTVITGSLSSEPNRAYVVAFLGPNQQPLGEEPVTTDGNGQASFSHTIKQRLVGQAVTAQATDTTTGQTSEQSSAVTVKQAKKGGKSKKGKKGKKGKSRRTSAETRAASVDGAADGSGNAKQRSGKDEKSSGRHAGEKKNAKKHERKGGKKHGRGHRSR